MSEFRPGHGLGMRPDPDAERPRLLLAQPLLEATFTVNRKLDLPLQYRAHYDQGAEGACVGFGYSWMMSILNRRKYDAFWLYREAQKIDPWPETPPESGTSEVAGARVLIEQGHRRIWGPSTWLPKLSEGISAVRWARHIDELRLLILNGTPFGMAVPWFENFDKPEWDAQTGWWIGRGKRTGLGRLRGWHFICGYGAQDRYQAFNIVNSWGFDYPLVKIEYDTCEYMRSQHGATFPVITDRQLR